MENNPSQLNQAKLEAMMTAPESAEQQTELRTEQRSAIVDKLNSEDFDAAKDHSIYKELVDSILESARAGDFVTSTQDYPLTEEEVLATIMDSLRIQSGDIDDPGHSGSLLMPSAGGLRIGMTNVLGDMAFGSEPTKHTEAMKVMLAEAYNNVALPESGALLGTEPDSAEQLVDSPEKNYESGMSVAVVRSNGVLETTGWSIIDKDSAGNFIVQSEDAEGNILNKTMSQEKLEAAMEQAEQRSLYEVVDASTPEGAARIKQMDEHFGFEPTTSDTMMDRKWRLVLDKQVGGEVGWSGFYVGPEGMAENGMVKIVSEESNEVSYRHISEFDKDSPIRVALEAEYNKNYKNNLNKTRQSIEDKQAQS